MSKWVIDINERWLVHDVFGREEPDDEFVIRYFNSIYGVKSVERFEEEEKISPIQHYLEGIEEGEMYITKNNKLVIASHKEEGYINWIDEDGITGTIKMDKCSFDEMNDIFNNRLFQKRNLKEFFSNLDYFRSKYIHEEENEEENEKEIMEE